jgi:hypothetical protein
VARELSIVAEASKPIADEGAYTVSVCSGLLMTRALTAARSFNVRGTLELDE